jgi:hypothetical protein
MQRLVRGAAGAISTRTSVAGRPEASDPSGGAPRTLEKSATRHALRGSDLERLAEIAVLNSEGGRTCVSYFQEASIDGVSTLGIGHPRKHPAEPLRTCTSATPPYARCGETPIVPSV